MGTLIMRNLFDKYKCDKGSKKHRYDRVYEKFMEEKRFDQMNILEIGCFKGESTEAWLEYFPHSTIYTIDIFHRTNPEDLEVLKDERVRWLVGDSTNAALPMRIQKVWGEVKFDFIIDDGGHWPKCNMLTFNNCFPLLKEDGTYFIEDVWNMDKTDANHPWLRRDPERYNMLEHSQFMSTIEKYPVKHHDLRHNTADDTYILSITHA